MKKIITITSAIVFAVSAMAQTMNVHFKNGTKVEFSSENVEYVDFTEKPSDPTLTPGDYVDLGLSVKWATCNLGANNATDYGNYYAWGETSPKDLYLESNYAYYNSLNGTITNIGSDIAGTEYDAATVNLGKDWRLPSKDEMQELINKCKWEKIVLNGVMGYYITGENGNTIFLPAGGRIVDIFNSDKGKELYYWTSNYSGEGHASVLVGNGIYSQSSYMGRNIRPVYSPASSGGIDNITDYVTVSRTGQGTTLTGGGVYYTVTFSINNSSTETIHLVSLAGVTIDKDLEAGETYSITLQGSTAYIQNYYQELVFTYNGKSYSVKG